MRSAIRAPYSFEMSSARGVAKKRGSPIRVSLSTVAIFIASETVAMYSGESWPIAARSKFSRMFSISRTITPPPGGPLVATGKPR